MNRKYIVALSVFMISNSWGMDTDDIRKQDLLTHFRLSEQEELKAQAQFHSKKQATVIAVRNAIAENIALLKQQGHLTVEKVSDIIKERISSGVTQQIDEQNLSFLYKRLYAGINAVVLDVKNIKRFSILNEGTLICVEHDSKTDDTFRIFQEKNTIDWELLLQADSPFCTLGVKNADSCGTIGCEGKQWSPGISNKTFHISSQGILIAYHVTMEDIAQYLIKNAQAVGK